MLKCLVVGLGWFSKITKNHDFSLDQIYDNGSYQIPDRFWLFSWKNFQNFATKENLYQGPLFMSQKLSWVSRELSCSGLNSRNLLQLFKTNLGHVICWLANVKEIKLSWCSFWHLQNSVLFLIALANQSFERKLSK